MAFLSNEIYAKKVTPTIDEDGDYMHLRLDVLSFVLSRSEAWILIEDMKRELLKVMTGEEVEP